MVFKKLNHKILILDTTLREGEQTPNVNFTIEEKLQIARKLDEIGVNMIEAGDPNVSRDVKEAIRRIAREGLRAEILAHCRALIPDVENAASCDVDRVAIFLGTSKTHLQHKLRRDEENAVELVTKAIEHAREQGLSVRFTAEDASRTDYKFLTRICKAAEDAGADRISIPDTVGIMTPDKVRELFQNLSKELRVELDTHCHNDLGMATANTLAALEGGATAAHVTINGLGERSGIAPLSEIAVALKVIYDVDTVNLEELPAISLMVERFSGVVPAPNTPIIGENAFTHKAGIHVAGVLADPSTYEGFPPELIGRQREIVIDKYTGFHAVKSRLERLGVCLNDDQMAKIVQEIKERPTITKFRDADLIELAEKITGRNLQAEIPTKVEALIRVKCESNIYTTAIARRLKALKKINKVYEVTGNYDIEVTVIAESTAELNEILERIREIEGVEATETQLVLKKFEV
ncbi:MAG: homocitrate synthase [Candidatus Bathyarchaeia archaeon]|nr:homocitrate synthase [Candidatus Bathyarchaeota archaeon]